MIYLFGYLLLILCFGGIVGIVISEIGSRIDIRSLRKPILDLMADGESHHELEITKRLMDQDMAVFVTLRQLEKDGYLTSYDGESMPERGGRPRRYYRLVKEHS